jgi:hypothetical protein
MKVTRSDSSKPQQADCPAVGGTHCALVHAISAGCKRSRVTGTSDPSRILKKPYFLALVALVLCVLGSTQVYAQVAEGTLSGRITGTTGARIPSVHLSIKNTANGDTNNVTSNLDGSFAVPNLSPGTYEITGSAAGFAEARTLVTIRAGVDQVADITMHSEGVGAVDQVPGEGQVSVES